MKYCFLRGWAGSLHLHEEPEAVQAVVSGAMDATDFLFKYCDGKFTDEDLSAEGNQFAAEYYGDDGAYLGDYAEHFGDHMYVSPESKHDFAKFKEMIERHIRANGDVHSPWWKFW